MRALLLAGLISAAAITVLHAQEPADTLGGRAADSLAVPGDSLRGMRRPAARQPRPAAADTLGRRRVQADSLAPKTPADSLSAHLADSIAGLPDTTQQKIRERSPIFPEDVDPYSPLGLGLPARVIGREDLTGWGGATLAEILPRLYPLTLDEQGGPGFFGDVRVPAVLPGQTRLLIDGRPLEGPMGPAADLRTIPITAIERIEIRPGAAAQPGGAEAGSINIVTRTHLTPQANSALSFEVGSLGREAFAGGLGRWLGSHFSVLVALRFDDGDTFTQVADAKTSQFWGKARLYFARRHFLEAAYGTSEATTESGRTTPTELSPFTGNEDRRERRLQLFYRGPIGPILATAVFYTDKFEEREVFNVEDFPLLAGEADRRGARGSLRIGVGAGSVEAGGEWQQERLDSESAAFLDAGGDVLADSTGFDDDRSRAALLAGVVQSVDSLSLTAQARIERFSAAGETSTEPSLSAEARYRAPGGFTPFVRLARGARSPSFVEAAAFARAGGREAVRVSTLNEVRGGSAWSRGAVSAEIGAFARRGSDMSLWLPPTGWRSALGDETVRFDGDGVPEGGFAEVNLLDLRAAGVDLRAEVPLPFGLTGELLGLVQSVEDDDGRRLPYVPRGQALGRLGYERAFFASRNLRVDATIDTRISSSRPTLSGTDLPAFAQMDAFLRARLIGFTAGLSAQNIFDQRIRTEEGFALPGRLIAFQIYWEFWN
jgi:outer membrane cobalamin receptor